MAVYLTVQVDDALSTDAEDIRATIAQHLYREGWGKLKLVINDFPLCRECKLVVWFDGSSWWHEDEPDPDSPCHYGTLGPEGV